MAQPPTPVRTRIWHSRLWYLLPVITAVVAVAVLRPSTKTIVGATSYHTSDQGHGSWMMLAVWVKDMPDAITKVVKPGFEVHEKAIPANGEGTDADSHRARAQARKYSRVVIGAWQAANRKQGRYHSEVPGMRGIGGPSAGMLLTLAGADAGVPTDLNGGMRLAATGTVEEFGRVGAIGGVQYKARAAIADDAEVMFAPRANMAELTADPVAAEIDTFANGDGLPDYQRHRQLIAAGQTWRDLPAGQMLVVAVDDISDPLWFVCGASGDLEVCRTASRTSTALKVERLRALAEQKAAERRAAQKDDDRANQPVAFQEIMNLGG